MNEKLKFFLENNQIAYEYYKVPGDKFPPQSSFWKERHLLRCKNLFFRDNHGKNHFLIVTEFHKKPDIKKLQELTGRGSMTMASGWRLEKYLGLKPGYISVFGLLNDAQHEVIVIIDAELDRDEKLSFLPNTQGSGFIAIRFADLIRFLEILGNPVMTHALS